MKVSLVTSLYRSAGHLEEFCDRCAKSLSEVSDDYEIILVNDASPDNSLEVAVGLRSKNDKIKIIDLSSNFGQHKALMTGIQYAKGDYVFMIDSDLEEPPENIPAFFNIYQDNHKKYDVIFGKQKKRKGNWFERISGALFYYFLKKISGFKLPNNPTPFRLMTRRYVNTLLQYTERELFFLGVSILAGYEQKGVFIKKTSDSRSGYSFRKKLAQTVDAVTSFSNKPLIFIFNLGIFITICAIIFIILTIMRYIIFGVGVEGWLSIVMSIWISLGLIIFCIGSIGIYLAKIFQEVKGRPLTTIKDIYE